MTVKKKTEQITYKIDIQELYIIDGLTFEHALYISDYNKREEEDKLNRKNELKMMLRDILGI